jgi:hypothetical protein
VRYSGLALTIVVQGSAVDARNLSPAGPTPSPQSKMAWFGSPVDPERSGPSDIPCSVRSATVYLLRVLQIGFEMRDAVIYSQQWHCFVEMQV